MALYCVQVLLGSSPWQFEWWSVRVNCRLLLARISTVYLSDAFVVARIARPRVAHDLSYCAPRIQHEVNPPIFVIGLRSRLGGCEFQLISAVSSTYGERLIVGMAINCEFNPSKV